MFSSCWQQLPIFDNKFLTKGKRFAKCIDQQLKPFFCFCNPNKFFFL